MAKPDFRPAPQNSNQYMTNSKKIFQWSICIKLYVDISQSNATGECQQEINDVLRVGQLELFVPVRSEIQGRSRFVGF